MREGQKHMHGTEAMGACACRVCPNMVRIVGYIVRKLNAVPQTRKWLAVRLSYGMNGILMPSMHLSNLADYMRCGFGSPRASLMPARPLAWLPAHACGAHCWTNRLLQAMALWKAWRDAHALHHLPCP